MGRNSVVTTHSEVVHDHVCLSPGTWQQQRRDVQIMGPSLGEKEERGGDRLRHSDTGVWPHSQPAARPGNTEKGIQEVNSFETFFL